MTMVVITDDDEWLKICSGLETHQGSSTFIPNMYRIHCNNSKIWVINPCWFWNLSVRQDVHAGLQHESAHRPRAQQTQAVAVSVLRKELCNYKWPETTLVKVVHLKLHIYNANNKFKVMGWERSISVKTVGENSQTGILQFFTGDQIKGRIKK